MQVLRRLEVLALIVADDVRVDKLFQDGQLGLQLFALLLRHLRIANLFATENLHHGEPIAPASEGTRRTYPSSLRLTLRMIPNEPWPIAASVYNLSSCKTRNMRRTNLLENVIFLVLRHDDKCMQMPISCSESIFWGVMLLC